MTRTRYLLARLFSAFGIKRSEAYRGNVAYETHLLREAEEVLGNLVWKDTEHMEEIASDYWQLRKLNRRHEELDSKTTELTEMLDSSQAARSKSLEEVTEKIRDKVIERDRISKSREQLRVENEELLRESRNIKRTFEGIKAKLEVLLEENNNPEAILVTKNQLLELRTQFDEAKVQRDAVQARMLELSEKLVVLNDIIQKENDANRQRSEEEFNTIGKANKELTNLRNEMVSITNEASGIFASVGQYLLDNQKSAEVKKVLHGHQCFVSLINNLRDSIKRNRRLFE